MQWLITGTSSGAYTGFGMTAAPGAWLAEWSANGVSMPDGLIRVTDTGAESASSSILSVPMNALTACLVAAYAPSMGAGMSAAIDATVMMAPPFSRRCRTATVAPLTTPK